MTPTEFLSLTPPEGMDGSSEFYIEDDYIMLRTIRYINQGNELTAEYWLYDIDEDND